MTIRKRRRKPRYGRRLNYIQYSTQVSCFGAQGMRGIGKLLNWKNKNALPIITTRQGQKVVRRAENPTVVLEYGSCKLYQSKLAYIQCVCVCYAWEDDDRCVSTTLPKTFFTCQHGVLQLCFYYYALCLCIRALKRKIIDTFILSERYFFIYLEDWPVVSYISTPYSYTPHAPASPPVWLW